MNGLGKADVVIRASDRMPIYLKYAEKMISEGFGFVCKCSSEEFKRLRETGESTVREVFKRI